jgi:hypothetical protein
MSEYLQRIETAIDKLATRKPHPVDLRRERTLSEIFELLNVSPDILRKETVDMSSFTVSLQAFRSAVHRMMREGETARVRRSSQSLLDTIVESIGAMQPPAQELPASSIPSAPPTFSPVKQPWWRFWRKQ